MAKFAKGKYALAISDRSGQAFPWRQMVTEWNGAFVHTSEYERKQPDRKSTRLNSSHGYKSYAVFCLKKKIKKSIK